MSKTKHTYPSHILAALDLIEELKVKGEHEKSIQEAQKLMFEDPNCVPALENIADNYVSLNKYDKAEKACKRALNLNKGSYTSHYILGFIASQNQDWVNAVKHLKIANELHPNNPEILRCLGWAMFNAKKRTQGVVILERALNLDPENPLTLCDLGICYMQTKHFNKSIELLKKAKELDPRNPRIQDCYQAAIDFKERYQQLKKAA